jgi:hypothetical protein
MSGLDAELWAMRTMVEELAALRQRAASVLRTFLLNRRPALPAPESPYENFPGTRVCDLAFLLLSRIFHLELSVSEFCNLPADGRDARIREFQASRAFQSAFESQP